MHIHMYTNMCTHTRKFMYIPTVRLYVYMHMCTILCHGEVVKSSAYTDLCMALTRHSAYPPWKKRYFTSPSSSLHPSQMIHPSFSSSFQPISHCFHWFPLISITFPSNNPCFPSLLHPISHCFPLISMDFPSRSQPERWITCSGKNPWLGWRLGLLRPTESSVDGWISRASNFCILLLWSTTTY